MTVPPVPEPEPTGNRSVPPPRIGDAERDRAVGYLQEHMAQGRLDADEFDERLTRALRARTAADLQPLFDDLPAPRPAEIVPATPPATPWSSVGPSAVVPVPVPPTVPVPAARDEDGDMPRGAKLAIAAVWPAAILLSFATNFHFWWIWVVAAVVTMFIRRGFGPGDRDRDRHRGIHGRDDGPPTLGR